MTYPSTTKVYLIGKETTKGTAVPAVKDIGLVQDITDDLGKEVIESMSISSIEAQQTNVGSKTFAQTVTVDYQNGRLFEFAVGEASHVETTGDHKHTFTIDNAPKSFTAESSENSSTDVKLLHAGCLIENLEMSIALNEVLKLSASIKGMSAPSTDSASAAVEDTIGTIPSSEVHVSLNGSEATEVQNFSVTIEKKVEQSYGLGSTDPQQAHGVELHVRFGGSLGYTDKTYQDLMVSDTLTAVIFNGHNGVTLGSDRIELKCTLANCIFSKFTKAASVGGLVFVDVEGTGTLSELFTVDDIASADWF